MKSDQYYQVQLVGNVETVKRMVASLFLVDAKKKSQILKVCVCDDLPHVINTVDSRQRHSPSHDLIESGLLLQVGFGRSLTIRANLLDENGSCTISPQQEVIIPPEAIWESNAAFATDFHIQLQRPYEEASVQVSITSKDELDSDIPLSVPPRVHVSWHPKDVAGVQSIRKTFREMGEAQAQTLPRVQASYSHRGTGSLPRYQQPVYQGIEKILQSRAAYHLQGEEKDTANAHNGHSSPMGNSASLSSRTPYSGRPVPAQDKNWNIVASPTPSSEENNLPQWAKGYGDQYDYDDIVVV